MAGRHETINTNYLQPSRPAWPTPRQGRHPGWSDLVNVTELVSCDPRTELFITRQVRTEILFTSQIHHQSNQAVSQ